MKCHNPKCNAELKESDQVCRKCGAPVSVPVPWMPDWRWHVKTLAFIYAGLTVLYFVLKAALK